MILPDNQLAALLRDRRIIDPAKLAELEERSKNSQTPLAHELVDTGILTDEQIGILIAESLKIPFVVLSKLSIPENVFHIIPEKIAEA